MKQIPTAMTNSALVRRWLPLALLLIAIAILFLAIGLFVSSPNSTLVVQGDSMAPHYVSGQQIGIDPLLYPNRWDAVVLRSPIDPKLLLVKRVIGLPGESVSIDGGEVRINGKLISKSLEDQKRVRVLVAKESEDKDSSWEVTQAGWQRVATGWRYQSQQTDDSAQISFNQELTDDLSYNSQISRLVNRVDDSMIQFNATMDETAELTIVVFGVEFSLSKATKLAAINTDSAILAKYKLPSAGAIDFVCSTFDGQATLEINGRVMGSVAIASSMPTANSGSSSGQDGMQIIACGGEVTIQELSVWRDVYYEDLNQLDGDTWQMGPDEWFVLGDNPPVSEDSRNWDAPAGVPTKSILGVVR